MEQVEKDKITAVLPKLIEQIDCNVALITELKAKQAIVIADECQLITYNNTMERSNQLLKVMFTRKNGYKHLVESLRKTGQTGALETLQESTNLDTIHHQSVGVPLSRFADMEMSEKSSNATGLKPFKKVPLQTKEAIELFTGRQKELDVLLKSLLPDGGTASITGIGGIGKTELAKMVLQTLDDETYENIFKHVIWINCDSAFAATTEFINIAKDYLDVPILGSSNQQRDISSIVNDVYDRMIKSKSLVVLDNVETRKNLQTFMPKSMSKIGNLSILITSQNAVLKIGKQIVLGNLELDEAIEFVVKGLAISGAVSQEFEDSIKELVLRLEMFPLAISQAIGYINEKVEMNPTYTPHEYIVDFERIPKRLLDGEYFIDISSQGRTTYKTLALALIKIEACPSSGLLASKILSKVAFMSAINIPSSFFSEEAEGDIDAVEGALVLAKRFSIIKYAPDVKRKEVFFSVHRLVQDVLRIRIAQQNETESILHSIMTAFCLKLDYDLISHALETWEHVTKIRTLLEEYSNFSVTLVKKMEKVGQLSDAVNFASSSFITLTHSLSIKNHAATIFYLQALKGTYLSDQGKFKDSLENLHKTLNEAQEYLDLDHWVISKLRYFIAIAYFDSGQNDEAAIICDKLREDYKLRNIVSLQVIIDIGYLQRNLRKFEDALETANHILENLHLASEIDREILEYDTKILVASIHGDMEIYDKSIDLYTEILQTYLKSQKSKSKSYEGWRLFQDMGFYQCCAGRFEEARDSFQKALDEMSMQKEQNCIWILHTKCSISSSMLASHLVDNAIPFCIEVHEQAKNLVDEKNFWFLSSLANVGVAYSKAGHHQDAVSILTKVFGNKHFVSGCNDDARFEKFYLAFSLEQVGNLEKANEIFTELRSKCVVNSQYKLVTLEKVESALERLKHKRNNINK